MKQRFCQRNFCGKVLRHKLFFFFFFKLKLPVLPVEPSPQMFPLLSFTSVLLKFSVLFLLSAWVNRAYGRLSLGFFPESDAGWWRGRLLPSPCSIKPSLAQPQTDQFRKECVCSQSPVPLGDKNTHSEKSFFYLFIFLDMP